ncbi:hypothetical protein BH10BAC3_BH10BAC3_32920 [soil metagenome]
MRSYFTAAGSSGFTKAPSDPVSSAKNYETTVIIKFAPYFKNYDRYLGAIIYNYAFGCLFFYCIYLICTNVWSNNFQSWQIIG